MDNKIIAHLKLVEVNIELYENRLRIKRSNGFTDIYLDHICSIGFDNKELWIDISRDRSWRFIRTTVSDSMIAAFIDAAGTRVAAR
jgi:hypothetical protein